MKNKLSQLMRCVAEQNFEGCSQVLQDKSEFLEDATMDFPLHVCALSDSDVALEIMGLLLDAGAKINARDADGNTPLHKASQHGNVRMCQKLLERGARNSLKNTAEEDSPIHLAARNDQLDVIRVLLSAGSDVNSLNEEKRTPLHEASLEGHLETCRFLVQSGADTDAIAQLRSPFRIASPLLCAIKEGHDDVALMLIKSGASVHLNLRSGAESLLAVSADRGNVLMTKALIEAGTDIHEKSLSDGAAIHSAVEAGSLDVLQVLIDNGQDVNMTGYKEKTPLHFAAEGNQEKICQLLVENQADVSAVDEDGYTPLRKTAIHGGSGIYKLLVEKGADPFEVNEEGDSLIHACAQLGNFDVCKLLIDAGVDPNLRNKENMTAHDLGLLHENTQFVSNMLAYFQSFKAIESIDQVTHLTLKKSP